MSNAIEVSNLTKYYGTLLAVDHIDLAERGADHHQRP